jgi:hypothetical protein
MAAGLGEVATGPCERGEGDAVGALFVLSVLGRRFLGSLFLRSVALE